MTNNQHELAGYPPAPSAHYMLLLLIFATIIAQLDRHVIGVLIDPIRHTMEITDTQVSLLQGLAFAVFFAFLGLPFGRLVDRVNRRNLLIGGVIAWSLMTALCGLAQNYWQLFFARMGVGIGEACLAPAAISLLTDSFRPNLHARVLGTFTGGSIFGAGSSFIVGGAVFGFIQTHPEIFADFGLAPWRITFLVLALPGLGIAALLMSAREPARHGAPKQENRAVFLSYWREHGGALSIGVGANGVLAMTAAGVLSWMAPFLARTYHLEIHEAGLWIGVIIIGSGFFGASVGGIIGDSAFIRGLKGEKIWVQVGAALTAVPLLCLFPQSPNATWALAGFTAYIFVLNVAMTAAPVVIQDVASTRVKGQASALLYLAIGLLGYGGGSTAVALATDFIFHDDQMLRYSLIVVGAPILVIASLILILGRSRYQRTRDAIKQERGEGAIDNLAKEVS